MIKDSHSPVIPEVLDFHHHWISDEQILCAWLLGWTIRVVPWNWCPDSSTRITNHIIIAFLVNRYLLIMFITAQEFAHKHSWCCWSVVLNVNFPCKPFIRGSLALTKGLKNRQSINTVSVKSRKKVFKTEF